MNPVRTFRLTELPDVGEEMEIVQRAEAQVETRVIQEVEEGQ